MWDDFLRQATGLVQDPIAAEDARRELQSHLEEATARHLAAGLPESEAARAAARDMGDGRTIALGLAGVHNRPLPWRWYAGAFLLLFAAVLGLAQWSLRAAEGGYVVIPVSGGGGQTIPGIPLAPAIVLFLLTGLVCLLPRRRETFAFLSHLAEATRVDLAAKEIWLSSLDLRLEGLSGSAAGLLTGIAFGASIWSINSSLSFFSAATLIAAAPLATALWLSSRRRGNLHAGYLLALFATGGFAAGLPIGVSVVSPGAGPLHILAVDLPFALAYGLGALGETFVARLLEHGLRHLWAGTGKEG